MLCYGCGICQIDPISESADRMKRSCPNDRVLAPHEPRAHPKKIHFDELPFPDGTP